MTMTDEQLAKLPAYARNEVNQLRARVAAYEADTEREPGSTDTMVVGLTGPDAALRDGAIVRFTVASDLHPSESTIDAHLRDGELEIRGRHSLVVLPEVSNVVRVRLR